MALQRWTIDASRSAAQFAVRHMIISKVRGAFRRWSGTIDFDPSQPEASKVSVRIETDSVTTNDSSRDQNLRSADFFDAEKFPAIAFESGRIESRGKDRFRVRGALDMHGVTRPVELDAQYLGMSKDSAGNERITFSAKTVLNRKHFGLSWSEVLETGGVVVGEQVEVSLHVQAIKSHAIEQAA